VTLLLQFLQDWKLRRIGLDRQLKQIDLGHFEGLEQRFDLRFRGLGARRGRAGGQRPQRQEKLVLDPEFGHHRSGEVLHPRDRLVHRVEEFRAVIDQCLEDFLERRRILGRVIPELETDDREHLTGRRNGPLNELAARLLEGEEQFRSERERRAGPSRHTEKFATINH
jgi:hypothetical protein